jgi:hypothetical protein
MCNFNSQSVLQAGITAMHLGRSRQQGLML